VLLSVSPVDPLDIFRGQYVDLRYDIGSIPLDDLGSGLADPRPGYVVYASLDTTGGLGSVSMLSADRPARGFYVRGTIERVGADSIFVSYGIESFFVREGLGPEIEQNLRRDARAKVVVDSSGNAVLVGLIAGGKEY